MATKQLKTLILNLIRSQLKKAISINLSTMYCHGSIWGQFQGSPNCGAPPPPACGMPHANQPALLHVEQLLLRDPGGAGLVLNRRLVLPHLDVRVGVGLGVTADQHRGPGRARPRLDATLIGVFGGCSINLAQNGSKRWILCKKKKRGRGPEALCEGQEEGGLAPTAREAPRETHLWEVNYGGGGVLKKNISTVHRKERETTGPPPPRPSRTHHPPLWSHHRGQHGPERVALAVIPGPGGGGVDLDGGRRGLPPNPMGLGASGTPQRNKGPPGRGRGTRCGSGRRRCPC